MIAVKFLLFAQHVTEQVIVREEPHYTAWSPDWVLYNVNKYGFVFCLGVLGLAILALLIYLGWRFLPAILEEVRSLIFETRVKNVTNANAIKQLVELNTKQDERQKTTEQAVVTTAISQQKIVDMHETLQASVTGLVKLHTSLPDMKGAAMHAIEAFELVVDRKWPELKEELHPYLANMRMAVLKHEEKRHG
jgi:hypothetical protein